MTVFYISNMGDYATWRASKPGQYDLKTFEVKARPAQVNSEWRVGMTAVIDIPQADE
jgi:HlyD family secretion protein